jgi:hypothetical protein
LAPSWPRTLACSRTLRRGRFALVLSLVVRLAASVTFFTLTDQVPLDDVFVLAGPRNVDLDPYVVEGVGELNCHFVAVVLVKGHGAGAPLAVMRPHRALLPKKLGLRRAASARAIRVAIEVELVAAIDSGNVRPLQTQNLTAHSARVVAIRIQCLDDTDHLKSPGEQTTARPFRQRRAAAKSESFIHRN